MGLSETKRSGLCGSIQQFFRFGLLSGSCRYTGSRYDDINFSVDKDIVLLGLCLFGSENNSYTVSLNVTDTTSKTFLVSKTEQFPSKLIQCEKCSYYGFQVLFDKKITLKRNTKYTISAQLRGPDSLRGENGIGSVKCQEVTFTFMKGTDLSSLGLVNGTTVQHG